MSETLLSRRSPGRSRGPVRLSAGSASAPCPFVCPPAAGGGLRDPKEGGLERRARLRVIGWEDPRAWGKRRGFRPHDTPPFPSQTATQAPKADRAAGPKGKKLLRAALGKGFYQRA